ncbi:MAG: hypothetical protein J1F63_04930 [Oscillospiraceae bacterium]|nr:hypothetical protein [Oscillospiraceae bacterium]
MNVKKVNRLCTVKGCKNTYSYAISRSSEYGGIIICRSCLEEALKAVGIAEEKGLVKVNTGAAREVSTAPLFYHPETAVSEEQSESGVRSEELGVMSGRDKKTFICTECGKEYVSEARFKTHLKTHEGGDKE